MMLENAILISPWSKITTDGKPSPKNYPWWNQVVEQLLAKGFNIYQVSCSSEPDIANKIDRLNDLSYKKIEELTLKCKTWISVDNMFHHLAWNIGKPGVVIFGLSDPKIFGHLENINLLKDRTYLRQRQFGLWSEETYNQHVFVPPENVVAAVISLI